MCNSNECDANMCGLCFVFYAEKNHAQPLAFISDIERHSRS